MEVAVVLAGRDVIVVSYFHRVLIIIRPHVYVELTYANLVCVDSNVKASALMTHTVRSVI